MSDGEKYLSLEIDLASNYYKTPSYKSFSGKHDEMTVSIVDGWWHTGWGHCGRTLLTNELQMFNKFLSKDCEEIS